MKYIKEQETSAGAFELPQPQTDHQMVGKWLREELPPDMQENKLWVEFAKSELHFYLFESAISIVLLPDPQYELCKSDNDASKYFHKRTLCRYKV